MLWLLENNYAQSVGSFPPSASMGFVAHPKCLTPGLTLLFPTHACQMGPHPRLWFSPDSNNMAFFSSSFRVRAGKASCSCWCLGASLPFGDTLKSLCLCKESLHQILMQLNPPEFSIIPDKTKRIYPGSSWSPRGSLNKLSKPSIVPFNIECLLWAGHKTSDLLLTALTEVCVGSHWRTSHHCWVPLAIPWCCQGSWCPHDRFSLHQSGVFTMPLCQGLCFCSELRRISLFPTSLPSPGISRVLQNTLLSQENTALLHLPRDTGLYNWARSW